MTAEPVQTSKAVMVSQFHSLYCNTVSTRPRRQEDRQIGFHTRGSSQRLCSGIDMTFSGYKLFNSSGHLYVSLVYGSNRDARLETHVDVHHSAGQRR